MQATLQLDELHVISDLHLGGVRPFQIFGSTADLASLIQLLAKHRPTSKVGLVVNGDFIDFLAEEPSAYFDPDRAIRKIDRILDDESFKPVFEALRAFACTDLRVLIVNLGNHDLELALPWVREHLREALCGDDLAARGRLRLVVDGTGVRCAVGKATVLCVHGNEVDSWNVTDFEKLRRHGRDAQFGKSFESWIPNAGSQMVIDVMNGIKRRYPFVDLLKPETEGVVPTLLALDPSALQKLRGAGIVAGRMAWDAARMSTGFLGEVPAAMGGALSVPMPVRGGAAIPGAGRDSRRSDEIAGAEATALLEGVEIEALRGTDPIDLVRGEQGRQLGFWSATWNLVTGKPVHEVLREALEKLDHDTSFDIGQPDDTFRRLDDLIAPDVEFVVAGHTHLERALPRKAGTGYYFNSGTWARLVKIDAGIRQDPMQFERVFNIFKGGTMEALDAEPGLVIKRCSIVSIVADGNGKAYGELRRMNAGQMQPVANSRFPKG